MKALFLISFGALLVTPPEVYAAKIKPSVPQEAVAPTAERAASTPEPETFLGISLGKPLPSDIEACPEKPGPFHVLDREQVSIKKLRCYDATEPRSETAETYGLPALNFSYSARVRCFKNEVEQVYLDFFQYDFAKAQEAFVLKYGDPTISQIKIFTTGAGAQLQGKVLIWKWPNVLIQLSEYGDNVRKSDAIVSHLPTNGARKASDTNDADKAAGAL